MRRTKAEILQEFGPFDNVDHVHGVTYDGWDIWFASGEKVNAIDPSTGNVTRSIDVAADAGAAFDGKHLYLLSGTKIRKLDPATGKVLHTIPAPPGNASSGLTWAEGTLWVGQYRSRLIYQIDPETGAILRTIESNRFVTGVTWVEDELWHATWEDGESEIRQLDPETGEVLQALAMPAGIVVSGLESDASDKFFCGGANDGKLRTVRRPKHGTAKASEP